MNHFMLHKVGVMTFYGQAFLPDVCEFSREMLPYTRQYFEELIYTGIIKEIRPSGIWYREREDFSESAVGKEMRGYKNKGFDLIKGQATFSGKILGGCLESMYGVFANSRFSDSVSLCAKYKLFPELEDWKGKILLLETSEEKPAPEVFRKMVQALKNYGIFDVLAGVLVGKPQNETYYSEYKAVLSDELSDKDLSVVYNVNVGHATPRCIIPFGVEAAVDIKEQVIKFSY